MLRFRALRFFFEFALGFGVWAFALFFASAAVLFWAEFRRFFGFFGGLKINIMLSFGAFNRCLGHLVRVL